MTQIQTLKYSGSGSVMQYQWLKKKVKSLLGGFVQQVSYVHWYIRGENVHLYVNGR